MYSFTEFCIYTFQWRQSATKPVIVEVISAHTQSQQMKAWEAQKYCRNTYTAECKHAHKPLMTPNVHAGWSSSEFKTGLTVIQLWGTRYEWANQKVVCITPQSVKKKKKKKLHLLFLSNLSNQPGVLPSLQVYLDFNWDLIWMPVSATLLVDAHPFFCRYPLRYLCVLLYT